MLRIRHNNEQPKIDPTARVAPTAVLVGDVTIGPRTSIGFGAIINAESGPITIGADCVVMENAVVRGVVDNAVTVGDRCLIGPRASLSGCVLEDEVFVATGASIFNGAHLGHGSEVRIHAVVHIRTRLGPFTTVPIGWVAVGDPAAILPPEQHDEIWAVQRTLDFPNFVFNSERPSDGATLLRAIAPRYAGFLNRTHGNDTILDSISPDEGAHP